MSELVGGELFAFTELRFCGFFLETTNSKKLGKEGKWKKGVNSAWFALWIFGGEKSFMVDRGAREARGLDGTD